MKFVYKIYSQYDGFVPAALPRRLTANGLLRLGWRRYLDEVDEDDDVWIHFRGHGGPPSIYARGHVDQIDREGRLVWLRIREHDTTPLVSEDVGSRIESLVSVTRAQVFAIEPDEFGLTSPDVPCDRVGGPASTCADRQCDDCPMWRRLPIVRVTDLLKPSRLRTGVVSQLVPGVWVRPKRQPRYPQSVLRAEVNEATTLFNRFKTGEKNLAYPLALAAYKAMRRRRLRDFDAIVPVPLSPDKKKARELDRCALLASELSRLTGVPVCAALELASPISKRRMSGDPVEFEAAYAARLTVKPNSLPADAKRILLVDDVCTKGSTLRTAATALTTACANLDIVAVTGAQMILVESVRREDSLLRQPHAPSTPSRAHRSLRRGAR